uniref:Cytochrome-c oxidase n=1 Tax=Caenorhabditis tropicalis TaxID=1561998 RepID=A0A1I7TE47_9PELO
MIFNMYMLSSKQCFLLSSYGLFALNMQSSLGLVIGLDRLYNVSYPTKYSLLPNSAYITLIMFCVLFSLVITLSGFTFSSGSPDIQFVLN